MLKFLYTGYKLIAGCFAVLKGGTPLVLHVKVNLLAPLLLLAKENSYIMSSVALQLQT